MEPVDVVRAVDAAIAIAAGLELAAEGAIVLHDSNRLTVRIRPCDVVARVAFTGREVAELEVQLARRLAEVGAPIGTLDHRVDPAVHHRDGFAVTLWTAYEPTVAPVSTADYADALVHLHAGMRALADGELATPHFTDRVASAQQIVTSRDLSPGLREPDRQMLSTMLRTTGDRIDEHRAPEQLLHGEPHPGNVLGTADGARFIDLETCCRGPIEFDLAHVPRAVSRRYPGVDLTLLDDARQLVLAMVAAWRWEAGDQLPNGGHAAAELLRVLRAGPPWATLDDVFGDDEERRGGASRRPGT